MMKIPAYHKTTEFLHIGTEPHRAYYIPYESVENALNNSRESSKYYSSLNGEWKFLFNSSYEDLPDGYYDEKFDTACLDDITVPCCWQLYTDRGYDTPLYSNLRYPFPTDPPHVPDEIPCGVYFKDIVLDKIDSRKYIVFEGVSSCFYLFVNGSLAGYSQISHSTSEFEITKYLKSGTNRITVAVLKWCDGTYLEDQDFFRLSGIFRDVYLLDRSQNHLTDIEIVQTLNDDFSFCSLDVSAHTACTGKYSLYFGEKELSHGEFSSLKTNIGIKNPVLWNAEAPSVYTLIIESENEFIPFIIGIRKAEIKNGIFLLNGKRVVFCGINRHDSDPDTGYYVSVEKMKNELYMLKRANVNAIRTSHYPNSPLFVQLCSILGFYLIDEADIETHGMGYDTEKEWDWVRWSFLSSSPEWKGAYVDRAASLFERDKNSPAVIMWSLGNESGAGVNHRAMAQYIRGRNPSAIIHYENSHKEFKVIPDGEDFTDISDVESRMYAGATYIENYLNDKANTKPFFMCEYVCSMSTGDVYPLFAFADKYDNFCGGCIWEWCDHAVNVPDKDASPRYFYGGDFGERPNDGICCVDGLVFPDRTPRPGYYDMKKVYEPFTGSLESGVLTVINRRNFTSLSDLYIQWEITSDGIVLSGGTSSMPEVQPMQSAKIRLFDENYSDRPNCFLTVLFKRKSACEWAEKDYEHGFLQFEIGRSDKKLNLSYSMPKIKITEKAVFAAAKGTEIVFDTRYARLISIKSNGNELLAAPVRFDIWKAPNYNGGSKNAWFDEFFDALIQKTYDVAVKNDGDTLEISTKISLGSHSHPPIVKADVKWSFNGDGILGIHCDASVRENAPVLPRFGLLFTLKKEFENVKYFGLGEHESYPDRYKSTRCGLYDTTVSDMFVHYVRPQENGNRFNTRYGEISNTDTSLFFEEENGKPFNFSTSHYSHNTLINTKHDFELLEENATYLNLDYRVNGISENRELDADIYPRIFDEKKFSFGINLSVRRTEK